MTTDGVVEAYLRHSTAQDRPSVRFPLSCRQGTVGRIVRGGGSGKFMRRKSAAIAAEDKRVIPREGRRVSGEGNCQPSLTTHGIVHSAHFIVDREVLALRSQVSNRPFHR